MDAITKLGLDLYWDIETVLDGERSTNRYALADVYKMVLVSSSRLPKKPISLLKKRPAELRRKVDNGCSMCLNTSQMERIVVLAKNTLREYKRTLETWILDQGVQLEPASVKQLKVKDLGPTLKNKKDV